MEYVIPDITVQCNYLLNKTLHRTELINGEYETLIKLVPNNIRKFKFEFPLIYIYHVYFEHYVPIIVQTNKVTLICIGDLTKFLFANLKLRNFIYNNNCKFKKNTKNLLYELSCYLHEFNTSVVK